MEKGGAVEERQEIWAWNREWPHCLCSLQTQMMEIRKQLAQGLSRSLRLGNSEQISPDPYIKGQLTVPSPRTNPLTG